MSRAPVPIDAALARLAGEVSAADLTCKGALPTANGRLLLGVEPAQGRAYRLLLDVVPIGPRSRRTRDLWLDFAPGEARDERLLDRASARLVRAIDAGSAGWLRRRNRERTIVTPTAAGLLGLLSGLLEPGLPFWHGWSLAAATEHPGAAPAVELHLVAPDGATDATVVIDGSRACPPGFEPVTATPLGLLARRRAPADAARVELHPERGIALALRLSLHAGMRWGAAPAPSARGAAAGPDGTRAATAVGGHGTLVGYCFRSARAWDMPASRFFGTWGDRDFFELLSLAGEEDATWVFHAGRECQMATAGLSPSIDQGANPYSARVNPMRHVVGTARFTDLDEASVIGGGEARLTAALAQAGRRGPVRVHLGCDYHVIGDDVPGICRCAREGGTDVEFLNPPLPRFTDASAGQWWRQLVTREGLASTPRSASTVNLVGLCWPAAPVAPELRDLLAASGIQVGSVFFPGRDAAFAEHARAARTVASPWTPVQTTIVAVMAERGFSVLSPPAPYGERPTLAWVSAVAEALGIPPPAPAEWRRRASALAPALPGLRDAARGVRVGLLADLGTAAELCSPAFFFGLDPLALLLDLGFDVHVVARGAGAIEPRRSTFPPEWRDRLHLHEIVDGADLLPHVRRLSLELVYCDALGALPVKRAGAHPFSIRDLEPGLQGATRSLRRLLGRARSRLYAEFGRHLGADA